MLTVIIIFCAMNMAAALIGAAWEVRQARPLPPPPEVVARQQARALITRQCLRVNPGFPLNTVNSTNSAAESCKV